jgi:hypothetical protein
MKSDKNKRGYHNAPASNQRKVSEDYAPEIARQKVGEFFKDHPETATTINKLSKSKVCVLAALLDDKSITTAGYSIEADYGVKRASSVIHALDKLHSFPISNKRIDTASEVGNTTQQSRFFITEEDREKLRENPEAVFKERHDNACRIRESQAQKAMKRLVKEYGEEGVRELLERAANDGAGPDKSAS